MRSGGGCISAVTHARARAVLFSTTLILCGLTVPAHTRGQTILNTERFQLDEVTGPHLSADLSASLKRGNAEVLDVSTSGMVGTVVGRHWPRLIFGGRYLSTKDRSILDDQFIQIRYSYILSPRTRTFHFFQAQENLTLLQESRFLLGTGVRRTFFESERVSLALGTGVMGEWETLDPDRLEPSDSPEENTLRMANLGVLTWTASSGARLLNIFYVQPDLGDLGNVRVLNDLDLSMPLTESLRATLRLEWRRDSRPPATLSKDDLSLRAGFALELS